MQKRPLFSESTTDFFIYVHIFLISIGYAKNTGKKGEKVSLLPKFE